MKIDNADAPYLDQSPFINQSQTFLPSDILEQYRDRIAVAQLPVTGLLVLILSLVLFFASMMADILVDRHADTIATLRSRGSSQYQIFASLAIQSLGLGLVALIVGPLLALPMTSFLLQHALSPTDQSVLKLISNNPVQVALELSGLSLVTEAVTLLAIILAIRQAMSTNVLTLRSEAARSKRRPLWQRLNLDIIAAIIALSGYGFSIYMTNMEVLDAQLRLLLLSPLTLFSVVFLVIAAVLCFLRFFPLLLQLGARVAARNRGATAVLAVAQMARASQQSVRMILLLALTTVFAIFTLIFTASQAQRILDVASYQAGADFSGSLPVNFFSSSQLAEGTAVYQRIPGVISTTLGYTADQYPTAGDSALAIPIDFRAVDADTFAQTASWSEQDSSQSLASLMAKLSAQRASAIARKVIPAIVDANTWSELRLAPGAVFKLNFSGDAYANRVSFVAIGEVQNIPTPGNSAMSAALVDFRSYAAVYAEISNSSSEYTVPLNTVWLRTRDDPTLLAGIRETLSNGGLKLDPLYDRRATIATLYHEPLYLTLSGVLVLEATTALLLALMGNLIASWLSVRNRLTNFALLRALGSTPKQIASVLTWEQSIIYSIAIVLGIALGAVFSALVVPALLFTSVTPGGLGGLISSDQFYALQNVPPIQVVIPTTLGIVLGVLVAICVVALGMMVRVVSQPSISQTLRLNED